MKPMRLEPGGSVRYRFATPKAMKGELLKVIKDYLYTLVMN